MKKSDKIIIDKWNGTGLLEGLGDDKYSIKRKNLALCFEGMASKLIKSRSNEDVETMIFPVARRIISKYDLELTSKQIKNLVEFIKNDFKYKYEKDFKSFKNQFEGNLFNVDIEAEFLFRYCEEFEYSV